MLNYTINFFLQSEEERTKGVVQLQNRLRTPILIPFLDPLARFFTFLSDYMFIVSIFPILSWGPICDGPLAWHLCLTIGVTFPIGNICKNITLKRRPGPEAWRTYTSTEEYEFSMPSTHAFNAMAMALVLACHYLITYNHISNPHFLYFWIIFPFMWSFSIALSRVYLGAHSLPDIISGLILGFLTGFVIYLISEYIRIYGNFITMIIGLSVIVLAMLYHPVNRSTPLFFHLSEGTFDYTPVLLGVAFGSISARYFSPNPAWMCLPGFSIKLLLRYVVFVPFCAGIYLFVEKLAPIVLEFIFTKLGIPGNYVPYNKYKEYVLHAVRTSANSTPNSSTNSTPQSSPVNSLRSSLSTLPSESESLPVNGNGNRNVIGIGIGSHTPSKYSNPKQLLCYTRLWGKLILYSVITWTVTIVVPYLLNETGL